METTSFPERIAGKINRMGLTGPAILLLEAHKPLAFLGSQLLLIAQPSLDLFFPQNLVRNTANLLADEDQLEQLIIRLEQNANQPKKEPR